MLILDRKLSQRIVIGGGITVTIVRIGHDRVRLGVDAPRNIAILRDDLSDEVREAMTERARRAKGEER